MTGLVWRDWVGSRLLITRSIIYFEEHIRAGAASEGMEISEREPTPTDGI